MNEYQRPESEVLEICLEEGALVTASTEKMNRTKDSWDD